VHTEPVVTNAAPPPLASSEGEVFTNSIGMKLKLIPAGEFNMGAEYPYNYDTVPVHRVLIRTPFYIGVYEVTQGQWKIVMGNNAPNSNGDDNYPVTMVSWADCQRFVKELSQMEKKTYRLPSEAEWEYACRAGSETIYSFGDDWAQFGDYAWYFENDGGELHPVGQKKPNAWGLYDMHGNAWEWCQDWHHDTYERAPSDGTAWIDKSGTRGYRSYRGGFFGDYPGSFTSAARSYETPHSHNRFLGLRVVCGL